MFTKNVLTSSIQGAGFELEYLVIAGGGAGGRVGGGGAGGYRSAVAGEDSGGGASAESPLIANLGVAYTVTIGAGGAAAAGGTDTQGNDGTSSVFASISSDGGGGGGGITASNGRDGGSGGGAYNTGTGGSATASQGFDGGDGASFNNAAAGGGGAGAAGADTPSISQGGDGGDGVSSVVTGVNTYRAGGGGGGSSAAVSSGGLGGGGNGAYPGVNAQSGVANTGGGGGGGASSLGIGSGGSGVVIIKVPRKIIAEFSAGVVYNYIPVDGFHVYEITGAGVSDTVTFKDGSDIPVTIDNSLRFNDNDSAYLSRTPASAGNSNVFTYSGWIKLGNVDTGQKTLLSAGPNNNSRSDIWVYDNKVWFSNRVASTTYTTIYANALLRDPSAWYHIVVKADQTKSFVDIYINGVKQETTVTSANYTVATLFNTTNPHAISRLSAFATSYFDGYMADIYFIDGQALDPSNFGHADDNGVWQPIAYPGTYGTNGFHLEFADNSTAAALGTDTSGNGNNWTPSGITTDDQVTDTPSVNYATWNAASIGADSTLSDGNLKIAYGTSLTRNSTTSTFGMQSGKWYWETEITASSAANTTAVIGISLSSSASALPNYPGFNALGWGYDGSAGDKYHNASGAAYGATYGVGDVIGIAFDADTGDLEFYKNNASQGVAYAGLTNGPYFPAIGDGSATNTFTATTNFGQRPFTYTPPTGFVALSSANLPTPTIADGKEHFDIALYTGTGKVRTVRGFEFSPDLVWIKVRSAAGSHGLWDTVRGAGLKLASDRTAAENNGGTSSTGDLIAFDANGFRLGNNTASGAASSNLSGYTYVGWNWNAGGSTVTNTDGTITSQVRANTTAGFSIVTYNPSFSSGQSGTIGHGLSVAPQIVITKRRDIVGDWWTFVEGVTGRQDDYLALNLTNAVSNAFPPAGRMTATTFTDSYDYADASSSMVAYCFHSVEGFSKFGTYTGNGSADGPFVYTGFRPAFVMMKAVSVNGEQWPIMDSKRLGYNVINNYLQASSTNAEFSYGGGGSDILSNGFKLRSTSTGLNGSGITFIYMAFAENPFKTARAR